MKFSIVIPLYNKSSHLRETIRSLQEQIYTDFEIIVVNDGSTDDSLEIAQAIIEPKMRIVSQKNMGVSSARNTGIDLATGEFILFLDADDKYLPNALLHLDSLINKYPEADFFCCNYYRIKNNERKFAISVDKILSPSFQDGIIDNFFYIASYHPGSFPCHCSSFCVNLNKLRKDNIRFPDGITHTEDVAFCSLLALKYVTVFSRECIHEYYLDAENNSRSRRPTEERYVITLLSDLVNSGKVNYPYLKSFINKNIIHLLYNCLEVNDLDNFNNNKKMEMFSYKNSIGKYRVHFIALKFIPYHILRFLYSSVRK
ncbi:glycosyltransferase family 2 protein [Budviciaceae bacterium CWB-B4]|uniref:Glycosyltransferase family 2 protein n=1 Tax=Limnobaculum xujianqingii TaxID=2738837 RepID=A0A9D7FZQ3_9GAMM|nr:glycosyltransferase family 2 protein [Limnobaculum xujianqingii]MBK5074428.1 glycosyltransferase family 2 protein [Limnobaculum xujianqingii]MBK5177906.1 glycosyltransferase family 2 protein [Limnobaculum xujianqingii]